MDNLTKPARAHSIALDNRKKISMTGVDRVVSSGDSLITLVTPIGGLAVQGRNLKILKFNAEDGSFIAEGDIDIIKYSGAKSPLLKRMFK